MKRKLTAEQERVERLLSNFGKLPSDAQECVIGYASGVADTAKRYRKEVASK